MHWSDEETSALVDAWGLLYVRRNRGLLRAEDWDIVVSAVNAHHASAGLDFNRNPAGCKRRIIALKALYKEEVAKGRPSSGRRHFAHLRAFLADPNVPPPGFAAKTPAAFVKKEKEEEVEEASGCVGGSVRTTKILDRSGGPSLAKVPASGPSLAKVPASGPSLAKMPASVNEEEVVGCGCELVGGPAAVVTKLAEVYERLEMERLKFKKEMFKMKKEEMEMNMEDVRLEHKKVKENPKEGDGN